MKRITETSDASHASSKHNAQGWKYGENTHTHMIDEMLTTKAAHVYDVSRRNKTSILGVRVVKEGTRRNGQRTKSHREVRERTPISNRDACHTNS